MDWKQKLRRKHGKQDSVMLDYMKSYYQIESESREAPSGVSAFALKAVGGRRLHQPVFTTSPRSEQGKSPMDVVKPTRS